MKIECEECDNQQELAGSKTVLMGRAGAGITVVCANCGHYIHVE